MRNSGLVLFACAGLLLSGGAILGGSTVWNLLRMSYYFWTSDLGVELGSAVTLVAASLLCLPACWLATLVPYHSRSTALAGTLMLLTTTAMLLLCSGVGSMAGLSRSLRDTHALNASMLRAMTYEELNPAVRSAFTSMQLEMKCCGVSSYTDWYQVRRTLPPACCNRVCNGKRTEQCDTPVHTSGCLRSSLFELRAFANSVTILAGAIIIVLAVTLFASAYTLVNAVMDRVDVRALKPPMHLNCFNAHGLPNMPIVPFTSPVGIPTPASQKVKECQSEVEVK